jgi:hypothetical protein
MVVGNMPEVELFEIGTRIIAALETEYKLVFSEQGTILLHPRTLFILHPAPLATMLQLFSGQKPLFVCQKMTARSAINPAWGGKVNIGVGLLIHRCCVETRFLRSYLLNNMHKFTKTIEQ